MIDIEFQVLISTLLEKQDLITSERNLKWQQPYAIVWRFTKLLIILKLGVFSND